MKTLVNIEFFCTVLSQSYLFFTLHKSIKKLTWILVKGCNDTPTSQYMYNDTRVRIRYTTSCFPIYFLQFGKKKIFNRFKDDELFYLSFIHSIMIHRYCNEFVSSLKGNTCVNFLLPIGIVHFFVTFPIPRQKDQLKYDF